MSKSPTSLKASDLFTQGKKARIEKIRGDISKRLRKACSHLSEEEYATLVEKMMKVQLGGEERLR